LRKTGFDYEHDLDLAAIAVIKGEKEGKLFAIAEGRFDRKKLKRTPRSLVRVKLATGGRFFSVPLSDGTRRITFAFVSKDKIALTDAADLAPFLGPAPNTADAREWRGALHAARRFAGIRGCASGRRSR